MVATSTTIAFDRPIELLTTDVSAWAVKVGFIFVTVTAVTKIGPDQVRLSHMDSAIVTRFVSMLQPVVAGEPDGTLAETFDDFPVN